jgi:cobalt/nickel transport system permease protein
VSHLHIPDGVLPVAFWAPALALALVLLAISAWRTSRAGLAGHRRLALQGTLGAMMLAAMVLEVPLGPMEYHLTLAGPIGVLLGPGAAFQVVFVTSLMLAFAGHGGFTVVGLNALVLGAGAALAFPAFRLLARRVSAPAALATATAIAQAASGLLWLVVVGGALRLTSVSAARLGLVAGLAFPVWLLGIVAESAVALAAGRFIARVRPDLLPAPGPA